MGTSHYFNNQAASREQLLIEDMIIESIRNHGIDVFYIPRGSQSALDELFGDDPVKSFTSAYQIEMFLETFNDFEGNQEFFSKFGLEVQKSARVAVARRSFERFIPNDTRSAPKEGDLIWLPSMEKLMEIKFVEEEKNFFQLGKDSKNPYMYGLTVEAFKYNGELINTGMSEIDRIGNIQAIVVEYEVNAGGTGTFTNLEWVYQGDSLATATAKGVVAYWNKPSRVLRLRNIKGEFAANVAIKSASNNASWVLTAAANPQFNPNNENMQDNYRIETEGDNILDWSETNPFGSANE